MDRHVSRRGGECPNAFSFFRLATMHHSGLQVEQRRVTHGELALQRSQVRLEHLLPQLHILGRRRRPG